MAANLQELNARVAALEKRAEESDAVDVISAFQKVTYYYNQLASALEQLERRSEAQEADHEQLAAYVDTLPKGGATQDVVYEFERIGAVLGNVFSILDSVRAWQTDNKKVYAIGIARDLVEQKQGTKYQYSEIKISDSQDIMFSGGAVEVAIAGAYRVTVHAYVGSDRWKAGGGADWDWLLRRGVAGFSWFGIYVNNIEITSEEIVTWNGPVHATTTAVVQLNSRARVAAGCTKSWAGDTGQLMYRSTMTVERLLNR